MIEFSSCMNSPGVYFAGWYPAACSRGISASLATHPASSVRSFKTQ